MTHDEMMEMARQAGYDNVNEEGVNSFENFQLEAFALKVIAQEREACAKLCEVEHGFYGTAPASDIRARGKK